MKERPILFSAPMVRALLDGTKTQTRRIAPISDLMIAPHDNDIVTWSVRFSKPLRGIRASHSGGKFTDENARRIIASQFNPYGEPGDRLWVRETWQGPLLDQLTAETVHDWRSFEKPEFCVYAADGGPTPEFVDADDNLVCRWRPSIHMPRWASRITLEITGVRVERLQDISRGDAMSEGCPFPNMAHGDDPRRWYAELWKQINGAESWLQNPWVWVVEFKKLEGCAA